jgi:hypothetical protein
MEKRLRQMFENIKELNPPNGFEVLVLKKIEKEKIKKVKRQLIFSYIGLSVSALFSIYTILNFGQLFLQSEFWNVFSLIFSDAMVVLKNWNVYIFSLLETFPAIYATVLLLPIFTMLISVNVFLNNKINSTHKYSGV